MTQAEIIKKTKEFVMKTLEKDGTGHDWWHIERVLNNSIYIAKKEKADLFIVQLGALLHDIADFKFHGGDDKAGGRVTRKWLEGLSLDEKNIADVCYIVDNVSFKGLGVKNMMRGLEGRIVQDADRLDGLGAIGIARAFAYGGHKNRPLYNPFGKAKKHKTFSSYKKGADSTIHHFYEKLLHIKKLMNTKTGRKLAEGRHKIMEEYLKNFFSEWKGVQ